MEPWKSLWTVALFIAGGGFTLITLLVILKGGGDLRRMLRGLAAHRGDDQRRPG